MGEESGYIRFDDPDAAVKARAAAVLTDEGGFIVKNHMATLEPLSGMNPAFFLYLAGEWLY